MTEINGILFRMTEYIEEVGGGVTALARGLELLRCFTPHALELSNGDMANLTGLPKSTVSRLTRTLVELGYLRQDGRSYRLGPAPLALGYAAQASVRALAVARPHMQALADATQTLVSLAARDRLSMIYLETCRGSAHLTARVTVGTQMPLATTSIGRACLAGLPAEERGALLDGLATRTPDWNALQPALDRELARFGAAGYCLSLGEWEQGTNAAATILRDGAETLALSIGGPAFAITARQLEDDLGPRLVALARHIEAQLP